MFVKIGPYRHRWHSTIYTKYMNKKYDHDWIDNNNLFERFLEKTEDVLQSVYNATINKILDKRTDQKINVRIDNYDIWSMDDTLAHIVSPMLKLLKEKKHGSAYVDDADVPESLHHKEALDDLDHPDHDDLICKRWDYVMNEMVWAFEQKTRYDWEGDYYEFDENTKGWPPKYKRHDVEGLKAHQERMSNGFRLFGKYYEALWD